MYRVFRKNSYNLCLAEYSPSGNFGNSYLLVEIKYIAEYDKILKHSPCCSKNPQTQYQHRTNKKLQTNKPLKITVDMLYTVNQNGKVRLIAFSKKYFRKF